MTDILDGTVWLIAVAFLLGGLSKGVVGFGLPLISIPIMASIMPVPMAIGLTFVPVVVSNTWQAFSGGYFKQALKRFWPLIIPLALSCAVGAQVLTQVNAGVVQLMVAGVLLLFVLSRILNPQFHIAPTKERWCSPLVGFINGLLGGVAGVFALLVPYTMGLRLPRDFFIASLGAIYLLGSAPLYLTLIGTGSLNGDQILASLLSCLPLCLGLQLGLRLRQRVSATLFERLLLVGLFGVAVNLARQGWLGI